MALPVRSRREGELASWHPMAELEQATKRLSRLLDEAWAPGWPAPLGNLDGFRPPADVEEREDSYVVEVELPGVSKQDVDVEMVGRRLTVSGERKERERAGILRRRTRTVGRFFYEVLLPGEVDDDAVSANLADGVLTVSVPKAAAERRQRRRITVQ